MSVSCVFQCNVFFYCGSEKVLCDTFGIKDNTVFVQLGRLFSLGELISSVLYSTNWRCFPVYRDLPSHLS